MFFRMPLLGKFKPENSYCIPILLLQCYHSLKPKSGKYHVNLSEETWEDSHSQFA